MNLALPALVILLGLLPGIACFYGYFAGRFNKRAAGVYGGEEIALYVVFAIPLDVGALFILRWFGISFDFDVVAHLLSGNVSDAAVGHVVTAIQQSAGMSAITYVLVVITSYAIGSVGRRIVWAFRIDTYVPPLRVRHSWFYLLQGRYKDMPRRVVSFADVLTQHGDQSLLYQGAVLDFEISPAGTIDSLTLLEAQRGSGRGADFGWKTIPSDRFTIMGSKIHSINMRYVSLNVQVPKGRAGFWHHARTCFRSFWFEEP